MRPTSIEYVVPFSNPIAIIFCFTLFLHMIFDTNFIPPVVPLGLFGTKASSLNKSLQSNSSRHYLFVILQIVSITVLRHLAI